MKLIPVIITIVGAIVVLICGWIVATLSERLRISAYVDGMIRDADTIDELQRIRGLVHHIHKRSPT